MVGNSLGEHRLTGTWRAVKKHAARRVDTDLRVKFRVRQRKLDSLSDFLLLDVKPADVGVLDVGLLSHLHHLDGSIGVGWQDVDNRL